MPNTTPLNLVSTYVRLRNNVTTELLPVDTTFWERISSGQLGSFHNEITLTKAGDYALIPKGMWHTAKTNVESTMLFITAGEGTEHRAS